MTTDTKPLAERLHLARTIEQYRDGSPGAIASGSPTQVINALKDAKHDVLMLADALDARDALLSEAAEVLTRLLNPPAAIEKQGAVKGHARNLLSRIEVSHD